MAPAHLALLCSSFFFSPLSVCFLVDQISVAAADAEPPGALPPCSADSAVRRTPQPQPQLSSALGSLKVPPLRSLIVSFSVLSCLCASHVRSVLGFRSFGRLGDDADHDAASSDLGPWRIRPASARQGRGGAKDGHLWRSWNRAHSARRSRRTAARAQMPRSVKHKHKQAQLEQKGQQRRGAAASHKAASLISHWSCRLSARLCALVNVEDQDKQYAVTAEGELSEQRGKGVKEPSERRGAERGRLTESSLLSFSASSSRIRQGKSQSQHQRRQCPHDFRRAEEGAHRGVQGQAIPAHGALIRHGAQIAQTA